MLRCRLILWLPTVIRLEILNHVSLRVHTCTVELDERSFQMFESHHRNTNTSNRSSSIDEEGCVAGLGKLLRLYVSETLPEVLLPQLEVRYTVVCDVKIIHRNIKVFEYIQ